MWSPLGLASLVSRQKNKTKCKKYNPEEVHPKYTKYILHRAELFIINDKQEKLIFQQTFRLKRGLLKSTHE